MSGARINTPPPAAAKNPACFSTEASPSSRASARCSTTGTNPPTRRRPCSPSTREASVGSSGKKPSGPDSIAGRPRESASSSTRSALIWWPHPSTSLTPHDIGAPAMRVSQSTCLIGLSVEDFAAFRLVGQPHGPPLTVRVFSGLCQDERRGSVGAAHLGVPVLAHRPEEGFQPRHVGIGEAFDEVGDVVLVRAVRGERLHRGPPVVVHPQRGLRAHDLARALVAVAGDAAVVYNTQSFAGEAEGDDGVVNVVHLLEPYGIGERRPEGGYLFDLADEPASRVEIVQGDIGEEPS